MPLTTQFLRGDSRQKREKKLNALTVAAGADDASLQAQIDGKAPLVHTHPISSVVGLDVALADAESLQWFSQL